MDEIERFAEDIIDDHNGRFVVIVPDRNGSLTYTDFLRLREYVRKRDVSIGLSWCTADVVSAYSKPLKQPH